MPWQPNGTFLRVNPDYSATPSGELWGQDLNATPSIKIIASRHDFHDQDLGDGIAACLNLDGLNAMRAQLQMGGFKITGLGEGTVNTDAAQYGQIAGDLQFDDGLRELSLLSRAGTVIDTVVIPSGSGGGGEGTVSSIGDDGNGTLEWSSDPITTTGVVGLKYLAAGQSYTGGISGIVIDDYGRVTQVTTGAYANTNLSLVVGTTTVRINSSTQTNTGATINAATSLQAGVMTKDQATKLGDMPEPLQVMTRDTEQTISGKKRFINTDTQFGVESLPSILFKGILIQSDGDVFIPNLPTSGTAGQIYNNGDGILRVG